MDWLQILYSTILAIALVFVGWSKKQVSGPLDWKGFIIRVPIAILVGCYAGARGIDLLSSYNALSATGMILFADQIIKIFLKYVFKVTIEYNVDEKDTFSSRIV